MLKKFITRMFCVLLLTTSSGSYAAFGYLTLIDNDRVIKIPVNELRQQAAIEFSIDAPFRSRKVEIRGIYLEDLLQKYLSHAPKKIKFYAFDGYEVTFKSWQKKNWVVVTHEDGKPLTVRQQGPLRMIEKDLKGRNPRSLREFNDWVWMLEKIEVLP